MNKEQIKIIPKRIQEIEQEKLDSANEKIPTTILEIYVIKKQGRILAKIIYHVLVYQSNYLSHL